MKNKGTWILTAVTLLVVCYAYFFEYKKRQSDDAQKEKDEQIIKASKDNLIRVVVSNKEKIVLEKKDKEWKIVSPVKDDADKVQVEAFLDTILREKAEIEISDELQDPKIYGLDKPVATLEITKDDGATTKVAVGAEAIQGKNYLRVDASNSVMVSSAQWKIVTEKTLKDFRSKEIFRGGDIHALEIEAPGHPKLVLKLSEGKWAVEGAKFALDFPAIKSFVSQIENLHALDIVSENQSDLAKYGLNNPAVIVRLVGKDNKDPAVLRISPPQNNKKDSYIVSSALKPVFKSYGLLSDVFFKKASHFRDREEPFKYTLAEVIGVRTKADYLFDYRFIKKGEAWYLEKPDPDHDVDQNQVVSLLTALQGARVNEYLGQVPFKAQRTIDLLDKDGNSVLKVELGDEIKGKNRRLAKSSLVNEIFALDSNQVDAWPGRMMVKEKAKEATTKKEP